MAVNHPEAGADAERPSSNSAVARRLLSFLQTHKLEYGDRLPPERELAAQLGVGRSAVRNALAALDFLGLVEIRQGSGSYLLDEASSLLPTTVEWGLLLGSAQMMSLIEARTLVEVAVARLAAERCTSEGLELIEDILVRMEQAADDPADLTELDVQFHLAVAAMSQNTVLEGILTGIQGLLRVWIRKGLESDEDILTHTIREHRTVFECIRNGDMEATAAAMTLHMRSAEARLRASLSDEHPAPRTA